MNEQTEKVQRGKGAPQLKSYSNLKRISHLSEDNPLVSRMMCATSYDPAESWSRNLYARIEEYSHQIESSPSLQGPKEAKSSQKVRVWHLHLHPKWSFLQQLASLGTFEHFVLVFPSVTFTACHVQSEQLPWPQRLQTSVACELTVPVTLLEQGL